MDKSREGGRANTPFQAVTWQPPQPPSCHLSCLLSTASSLTLSLLRVLLPPRFCSQASTPGGKLVVHMNANQDTNHGNTLDSLRERRQVLCTSRPHCGICLSIYLSTHLTLYLVACRAACLAPLMCIVASMVQYQPGRLAGDNWRGQPLSHNARQRSRAAHNSWPQCGPRMASHCSTYYPHWS